MIIFCENEIQMARLCAEFVRQQVTFSGCLREMTITLTGGY
jgi:hypothetical protein